MEGYLWARMRPAEPGKEQTEQMRSLQALPEAARKKAVKCPAAGFSCQAIFQKGRDSATKESVTNRRQAAADVGQSALSNWTLGFPH
jgi:hypothetical protein